MGKTICNMDGNEKARSQRNEEHYECHKCNETAHKEKYLCKPVKIK